MLLSDLYFGYTNRIEFLVEVVDKVNKLEPGIVCRPRDIFNGGYYVLNDENIVIEDKVTLVGRKDSSPIGGQGERSISISEQITQVSPDLPLIVMDYPPSNLVEYGNEVDYGFYQKDKLSPKAIVTSGVGTWGPPMRIGTKSEVVEILIRP